MSLTVLGIAKQQKDTFGMVCIRRNGGEYPDAKCCHSFYTECDRQATYLLMISPDDSSAWGFCDEHLARGIDLKLTATPEIIDERQADYLRTVDSHTRLNRRLDHRYKERRCWGESSLHPDGLCMRPVVAICQDHRTSTYDCTINEPVCAIHKRSHRKCTLIAVDQLELGAEG